MYILNTKNENWKISGQEKRNALNSLKDRCIPLSTEDTC
jgi:hypothetical protein